MFLSGLGNWDFILEGFDHIFDISDIEPLLMYSTPFGCGAFGFFVSAPLFQMKTRANPWYQRMVIVTGWSGSSGRKWHTQIYLRYWEGCTLMGLFKTTGARKGQKSLYLNLAELIWLGIIHL